MSIQRQKRLKAVAVFLSFVLVQAYIQLSFAGPASPSTAALLPQQQILARLTTAGNRPILINNNSASTGDNVFTDATIETPPGTAATIDLGPLGKIDIAPGSKIKLEFECPPEENLPTAGDAQATVDLDKKCNVKVTVMAGCVTATGGKKGNVEIATEQQGRVADTDDEQGKKGGGVINYCFALPGVGATGGGIGTAATAGILSAAVIPPFIYFANKGDNPSPIVP